MDDLNGGSAANLKFAVDKDEDGSPLLRLEGDLELTSVGVLEAYMGPVIARSPDRLVIDASRLEFADSSGIALLVRWANLVPNVELREPTRLVRGMILMKGLGGRLRMAP